MSETAVKSIVENLIADNWALTDVDWDNVKYTPKAGRPFITPKISEVDSIRRGERCWKRTYSVIIELRVSKGSGTENISSYANTIKSIFEGYNASNFHCIKGRVERVGIIGKWYQKNVVLTCTYIEYK